MKSPICYLIFALIFFITMDVKAQQRPVLDATYLASEYKKLMSSRIFPKKRTASIYLSSGMNNTLRVGGSAFIQNTYQKEGKFTNHLEKGFQVNLGYLKSITDNIDINVGVKYATQINELSYKIYNGHHTVVKEKHKVFSIPIKGRYSFFKSSLRPFVELGATYSRLLKAEIAAKRNGGQSLSVSDINIIDERNKNLFSMNIGLGLEYTFYKGSLFVLGTYSKGLSQLVIAEKRFDNAEIRDDVRYVSSDFTLNNIELSIGYSFFLFGKE